MRLKQRAGRRGVLTLERLGFPARSSQLSSLSRAPRLVYPQESNLLVGSPGANPKKDPESLKVSSDSGAKKIALNLSGRCVAPGQCYFTARTITHSAGIERPWVVSHFLRFSRVLRRISCWTVGSSSDSEWPMGVASRMDCR